MLKKITVPVVMFIFFLFFSQQNGFSFAVIKPGNTNSIENNAPDYLKASVFVKMSAKEFAAASGKKLNLFQRMYFKVIQKQVKRGLKKNPDLLMTDYLDESTGKFKFNLLWFIIASFIGPLGVLAAYTSSSHPKDRIPRKDKINSAWLGFAFFIIWFGFIFVF